MLIWSRIKVILGATSTFWAASMTLTAMADTIHVPADQPTIAKAADIAQTGDTIVIAPGTYDEGDIMWPMVGDLSIEAAIPGTVFLDGRLIAESPCGPIIQTPCDEVDLCEADHEIHELAIDGLNIAFDENRPGNLAVSGAILVRDRVALTVTNCDITAPGNIAILNTSWNDQPTFISNCTIHDSRWGISMLRGGGSITDTVVINCARSVTLANPDNVTMTRVRIENSSTYHLGLGHVAGVLQPCNPGGGSVIVENVAFIGVPDIYPTGFRYWGSLPPVVIVGDIAINGDINADGFVDLMDLLAVIAGWGTPDGDVSGDGLTNLDDLMIVIANWS